MTKATKYIRKIRKVDYINAKQYLERNGWKVVLFNTPNGNALIDKLGLVEYAKRTDGFVYDVNCLKYVFINGQLSDRDKLVTILHETGHIELEQDLTSLDKLDEAVAWRFACDVLFHTRSIIRRIISYIIVSLLTTAVIFACHSISNKIENTNQTVYVTTSGEKYHTSECYFIQNRETISLKMEEALKQYEPCTFCNPHK